MDEGRALAEALGLMSDLTLMRERRVSREAGVGEVSRFYTAEVGKLIDAMVDGARGSDDLRIVNASKPIFRSPE